MSPWCEKDKTYYTCERAFNVGKFIVRQRSDFSIRVCCWRWMFFFFCVFAFCEDNGDYKSCDLSIMLKIVLIHFTYWTMTESR